MFSYIDGRLPSEVSEILRLTESAVRVHLMHALRQLGGLLGSPSMRANRFALGDIMKAHDTFGNAAKERALKVILTNPERK